MFTIDKEDPLSKKRRERQAKLRRVKGEPEPKPVEKPKQRSNCVYIAKPKTETVEPENPKNPLLEECMEVLDTRLRCNPQGFWLDNRPVGRPDVIRTANRQQRAEGKPQIGTNREWWE